jgi:hypothetical protein
VRYQFTPTLAPANDVDILWMRSRTPRRLGVN